MSVDHNDAGRQARLAAHVKANAAIREGRLLMSAYHNDAAIKARLIARIRANADADEIVNGLYWRGSEDFVLWGYRYRGVPPWLAEQEAGIPASLAHLEDRIFKGLPPPLAKEWPLRFAEAVPAGADLSMVTPRFLLWLIRDGEISGRNHPLVRDVMAGVVRLLEVWCSEARAKAKAAKAAARAAKEASWAVGDNTAAWVVAAARVVWPAARAAWAAARVDGAVIWVAATAACTAEAAEAKEAECAARAAEAAAEAACTAGAAYAAVATEASEAARMGAEAARAAARAAEAAWAASAAAWAESSAYTDSAAWAADAMANFYAKMAAKLIELTRETKP